MRVFILHLTLKNVLLFHILFKFIDFLGSRFHNTRTAVDFSAFQGPQSISGLC